MSRFERFMTWRWAGVIANLPIFAINLTLAMLPGEGRGRDIAWFFSGMIAGYIVFQALHVVTRQMPRLPEFTRPQDERRSAP